VTYVTPAPIASVARRTNETASLELRLPPHGATRISTSA
jgi:hypothetical protein